METSNYLHVIKAHKLLIKVNKLKLPKYFENFHDDTDDELNDKLNTYKKDGLLGVKYYDLLNSVGKFINKYDIDVSTVKKSTLDLINSYCRIKVLNKPCFSERDDETDEINDKTDEINNKTDEINNKPVITDIEHANDLRIILRGAIKNNDRDLMICTMNVLRKFDEDKINTPAALTTAHTISYSKTPKWLIPLKCTINPENNKKLDNKSFKYAVATSKTSGKKRFRLTNIEKFMHEFNFETINYPPCKKDYETFETNNLSIKLIILKETNNEKELVFKYNQTNKNDRENKLFPM